MINFKKLCTPAMLYFVLSAVSFLGMLMQNCTDSSKYKVGTMEVETPCHNAAFFVVKALYILFWTYILNMLCKKGFKTVSWALVLLPFLGMFLVIGLVFIALLTGNKKREGMDECDQGYSKDANGNCVEDAGKPTGAFSNREGMEVPEDYGEQFEPNQPVEGNLPPIPKGFTTRDKKRESFVEGMDDCPEGEEMVDGKCKNKEGFYVREGMENECPEGQEMVDGKCKNKKEGFYNREGFYEGMSAEDAEGYDDQEGYDSEEGMDDDEGFVGGGNWPPVGQLL